MSTAATHPRRHTLIAVLAVAIATAVLWLPSAVALAAEQPGEPLKRLAGDDRYTTAVAASQTGWENADTVVIASGADYPDALAATSLAIAEEAPILLTPPQRLHPAVAEELRRLSPDSAVLVGGLAAIGETVEREVAEALPGLSVRRIGGTDRFDTAAALASEAGAPEGTVALASGRAFADALSASSLAAEPVRTPTLLVEPDAVPAATWGALEDLDVERVVIVGGTAAVAAATEEQLGAAGYDVDRLAGQCRYETSHRVTFSTMDAASGSARGLVTASGSSFPDALVGGPLAAKLEASLLLLGPNGLHEKSEASFTAHASLPISPIYILGGPAAVGTDAQIRLGRQLGLSTSESVGREPSPEPAPVPGDGELVGSLSQLGVTWRFDGEYEAGTYANGDFWVVGPVDVVEIDPVSETVAGRTTNGSMLNPSPRDGATVGYDSDIRDVGYDASKNVALGISEADPLTVPADSSLVSTISVEEADARPGIHTAAVLTVVDEPPAEGSFRPPYSGDDKTSAFTVDDLDRSLLPALEPVEGAPDAQTLAGDFDRVWLDHVPGWNGRSIHPVTSMPDYGRLLAAKLGEGYLTLMLDQPEEAKEALLVNLVQVGIDFHGIVADGGERNWVPNGGHAQGRKLPILFAGTLLDDPAMAGIGQRDDVYFGEDAQTFYITEETLTQGSGYTAEMIGTPEWGIRHATDPSRDDAYWGASYRRCSTANSWGGHVLVARIMGLQDAWNHDALFDYTDRYLDTETPDTWYRFWNRPFTETMWDTYRPHH